VSRGKASQAKIAPVALATAVLLLTSLMGTVLVDVPAAQGAPLGKAYVLRKPVKVPHEEIPVMLAGDSVAESLGWGLEVGASQWHVDVEDVALVGCGVTRLSPVYYYYKDIPRLEPLESYCQRWPQIYEEDVRNFDPAIAVLLVGRWEVLNAIHDGHWVHIGQAWYDSYLERQLEEAVQILSRDGAQVVLLTAPYYHTGIKTPSGQEIPEDHRWRVRFFNALLKKVAAKYRGVVHVWNFNREVDPQGRFQAEIDGVFVRRADGVHMTIAGGIWLQSWFYPKVLALARQVGYRY